MSVVDSSFCLPSVHFKNVPSLSELLKNFPARVVGTAKKPATSAGTRSKSDYNITTLDGQRKRNSAVILELSFVS